MVKNPFSVFKGQRVLVTGDTGFKGSWLSLWLHELGAEVVGYALPPEQVDGHFNLLSLKDKIRHIDGDIRDYDSLYKVFDQFKPQFLFHLAAQPLVRLSYDQPKLTFDTNVGGSVNILEAVRHTSSLRSVIYVTSDKCYRNKEWTWGYRENDELGGHDPYSGSKAAAELVFASYADSFFHHREGLGIASVRAGNVIGGGDWAKDRIVPDSIRALRESKPVVLRNPTSTRPWQHVLEPLSGYLLLASKLYSEPKKYSSSWNFGPDISSIWTVGELADEIARNWGKGTVEHQVQKNAPHEAGLLHLNCDKARQQLGWRPNWNIQRTLKETVHWYKKVTEGESAHTISRQQIRTYMEEIS